jgi:hypothetical protein
VTSGFDGVASMWCNAAPVHDGTNKREFFQLVVEKEATKCWSWIGELDADGRPLLFRAAKSLFSSHFGVLLNETGPNRLRRPVTPNALN